MKRSSQVTPLSFDRDLYGASNRFEGYERSIAVNDEDDEPQDANILLSTSSCPFLLTDLLLDTMKATAKESREEGRIVNVSSFAHNMTYKNHDLSYTRSAIQRGLWVSRHTVSQSLQISCMQKSLLVVSRKRVQM